MEETLEPLRSFGLVLSHFRYWQWYLACKNNFFGLQF
jgi:hypothetical protein